jgi:hypothetical protein
LVVDFCNASFIEKINNRPRSCDPLKNGKAARTGGDENTLGPVDPLDEGALFTE